MNADKGTQMNAEKIVMGLRASWGAVDTCPESIHGSFSVHLRAFICVHLRYAP
jgi:hypothetical protein